MLMTYNVSRRVASWTLGATGDGRRRSDMDELGDIFGGASAPAASATTNVSSFYFAVFSHEIVDWFPLA